MTMKKIKYIASALLLSTVIASCDLEKFPKDAIETSQSFEKVSDAEKWDNMFYTQLRGRYYGIYTFSTDVQADQLNATVDFGNRNGGPHRWDFLAGDYTIRDVWQGYYNALNNINTAIQGFATITPENDEDAALLKQYTGDAHLARAYYYLNLVLRWSKAYNASTASSDLGVPLVLEPDLYAMPARASIQEVYDQILADIAVAKGNLGSIPGAPGSVWFNKDVVTALEARVKLYMNDWAGAKTAAESLLNSGTYTLYDTQEDIMSMWAVDAEQEVIFAPYVNISQELPNTNNIYIGYSTGDDNYRPDFVPSQWVVDMYDDADFRKAAYFKEVNLYLGGADYTGYIVNKYPGNPALYTGPTNYANSQKMFRIGEIYLIAAEAAYRSSDEGTARDWLNDLREARGLSAVSSSGDALLQDIKDERFRELAFEGFRLDDLKRWGEGFTRRDPQNTDYIQTGPNFDTKTVTADNDKFVWGIPANDDTVNDNIDQNNGW